jgi:hypothetical protein
MARLRSFQRPPRGGEGMPTGMRAHPPPGPPPLRRRRAPLAFVMSRLYAYLVCLLRNLLIGGRQVLFWFCVCIIFSTWLITAFRSYDDIYINKVYHTPPLLERYMEHERSGIDINKVYHTPPLLERYMEHERSGINSWCGNMLKFCTYRCYDLRECATVLNMSLTEHC